MRQTYMAKPSTVEKKWYVIDAEGQTLGRLSSEVASILRGKHKPTYTPHIDTGDNVIIINAEKIELSGLKTDTKEYLRYTGYPGGQRIQSFKQVLAKFPERIIEKAVKGMLPKNKLGAALFRNLKVYAGAAHNHESQKPVSINLNDLK